MVEVNMNLCETHLIGTRTRERIVSPKYCKALAEHHIDLAGQTIARTGYRFIRLSPRGSQVLACTKGWGEVLVEGRWQKCSAGQAYLTPPKILHAYRAVASPAWEFTWVTYREGQDNVPAIVALANPVLVQADPRPLSDALTGLHRELVGYAATPVMHHWVELVQANVRRIVAQAGSSGAQERLRPLWEVVAADLARGWTLDSLAEIVNISGEHLRRLCVEQLQRTPMHHVTHLRMQRATELLAGTQRRIQDIAQAVGYSDPFAFATAFKRHQKMTPTRYRAGAMVA